MSHQRDVTPSWIEEHIAKANGCWLWLLALNTWGYAQCWKDGKARTVHRVMWEMAHGPIPDGLFVLHRCDRRHCVNPDHLFLGTQADNMHDKKEKGRAASGNSSGRRKAPELWPVGEQWPNAKLSSADVQQIKQKLNDGVPQIALAKQFNVSPSTIYLIRKGRNWKRV